MKRTAKATHAVAATVAAAAMLCALCSSASAGSVTDAMDSRVALVLDQDTNEVLMSKNADAVLPIASITKLMTAMVILEAALPLDEVIAITSDDVDELKHSSSKLQVGTKLTRGELLQLALMSSENRAAHALGRTYPGGMPIFVLTMNAIASRLGMSSTRYVEPTGLSSANRSTARDLAILVAQAHENPLISAFTTSSSYTVASGKARVQFGTTNQMVTNKTWELGLQKTGYIVESGRCLVMQARIAGRRLIAVLLNASDTSARLADAERVRRYVVAAKKAKA